MVTIYLVNILHKISIYSKYKPNLNIISKPFNVNNNFEYACNIVVHIHSKYTFVNPNIPNYTP